MNMCLEGANGTRSVDFAGDDNGGFIFSEFQPSFDAMFAFGKLLEMLAKTDLRVPELAAELPKSHVLREDVHCPWEAKGKVMRVLTREADALPDGDNRRFELIDGIKFYQGRDWALVLPDASEPYFHVYAEADDPNKANAMLCEYVEKIEALRG
jgi:mannose-1-phosphate guanylyltransferase/phosphomannomutase